MRNKNRILLEQLDNKIAPFKKLKNVFPPEKGWIYTIRTSLNMSMRQLGKKLNISRQAVSLLEEREVTEAVSIRSMNEVAEALNSRFVYGFIPKDDSYEKLVEKRSYEIAKRIVLRTNQNMKLEDQGIESDKIKKSIDELAEELKRAMKKTLWD